MLQNIFSKNRSGLLRALLFLMLALPFASCKDDEYVDYRVRNDEQIQAYFKEKGIDPATVTKTKSGLYYQVLEEGTGTEIFRGDNVAVNYVGTLLDGTEFDSSYKRGKPIEFKVGVGQVIPGWDEGLQLMREGEKARLFIPSHLGYGPRPTASIPANSVLVFEMKVEDVK